MSSRKDQKEQLRQERLQREQAAASAAQRKKVVGYGVGGLLAVAAVAAVIVAFVAGGGDGGDTGAQAPENAAANAPTVSYNDGAQIPEAREFDLEAAARAADCRLESPPNEGAEHVEGDVQYEANPPTSGNHDAVPTEDGAYTSTPRTGGTLHSLEHGRVSIQFSPDLPQQQIDQLKALFDEDAYHMLLYPNGTDMPSAVAATAWDQALLCERFSPQALDAIRAFKDAYRDKGPEFVP